MYFFSRLLRLLKINLVFIRYGLDEWIWGRYPLLFFLVYINPWYWLNRKRMTRGERLRRALEELGPIFVKAGQILSTRRDFLPEDIAHELAKLQDRVPPFSGRLAQKMIEEALQCNINDIFSEFDLQALASASIAQVHAAVLKDGKSVVVKVLRPQIKKIIAGDMDLFMLAARLAQRFWFRFRHFKPQDIVNEIAHTLYEEVDLRREAANASQLKRNFSGSTQLYIPEIQWPYCRSNVLVMERISGIPIHDIVGLNNAGVSLHSLAELGVEIFFTQVFRDSFFHADLHPGNIFVSLTQSQQLQINMVDFGIVGSLNAKDQRYIAENMIAFFKRDYQRVAELHIACGWLPPNTRIDQFEAAIRAVSEPIFERPLKEISFGELLLGLFQVARHFHIQIQPQLILLQKTLLSIEGLTRSLSPDLDLWKVATPHLERWLKKQVGPRSLVRHLKENFPLWTEQLPAIPNLLYEVLSEKKRAQEYARFMQTETINEKKSPATKHGFLLGVAMTLLFGGGFLWLHPQVSRPIAEYVCIAGGAVVLIGMIFSGHVHSKR